VKRFAAALLTGSIVALAAVGPVFASSDGGVWATCRWFSLDWHENFCDGCSTDVRRLENARMAHGVAFASACWSALERDHRLRKLASDVPIQVSRYQDRIGCDNYPEEVDATFRRLDRDTVATLYAVHLGSFATRAKAAARLDRWRFLHQRDSSARLDSLSAIRWGEYGEGESWSPDLYLLPPKHGPSGKFDLMFGLLIDRRDANRLARTLAARLGARTRVLPVRVTADVLAIALGQAFGANRTYKD